LIFSFKIVTEVLLLLLLILRYTMFDKPFDNTITINSDMDDKFKKIVEIYKSKLINMLTKEIK
jgi:hypothetical protein